MKIMEYLFDLLNEANPRGGKGQRTWKSHKSQTPDND